MINLFYISTEIFLSLSILTLLLIGVFKNKSELFIYNFTCIILLVGLAININLNPEFTIDLFNNSYKIDYFTTLIKSVILISAFLVMLYSLLDISLSILLNFEYLRLSQHLNQRAQTPYGLLNYKQ